MEKKPKAIKYKDFDVKQRNKKSFNSFEKKPNNSYNVKKSEFNKGNNESDHLYLKGRHEVIQALESGQSLNAVYISLSVKGPISSQIKELASAKSVPVKELAPDVFEKKFGEKTQGIAADTSEFNYTEFDDLIQKAENGHQVIVALNQVEDARNLGAIVRTVEAMGCDGVIIPKHRSAGMTEWAIRTAQGASAWLAVSRVNNLSDALEELKEKGYWVVGLDGSATKQLTEVKYDSKVVLVAGGEDVGLGDRVKKSCDDVVKIPMSGKTTSLNVSVSVAMAIYEILRQKNFFS
ncbi:MAG: 23S rRNA (guanosine(2251)-2'-O)-methyltransferase RlmB [Candidatus Riflebacteria bacterium]|nr:23S rRNA (guanosine(2251)-2'-O)-methyltransferase RlmB [Candidatus Riflebacteria bacterium]